MLHTTIIRFSNFFIKAFFIVAVYFISPGCTGEKKVVTNTSINTLTIDSRVKRKMKAGEIHQYSIYLKTGEFFHAKINQYDIDVLIRVTAANGQPEQVFDIPTGELDAENIYLLSESDTKYDIEISTAQKYPDPGEYDINIVRLEKATDSDKKWIAALTATQKADRLRKPETRTQSIAQYETTLALWKELKDDMQYAKALRSLGFVYAREKNYDKAIEIFNRLIPIWKQLGETRSEGYSFLVIGWINNMQKDYKQSLENNLKSIEYWVQTKDIDQESFTLMNIGTLYSKLDEKQKAINYFEQALKKSGESKRPSVKALILREYASAILPKEENGKAVELYKQSLKQWLLTVNSYEEARTAVMLAIHFAEKSDKQQAVQYYEQALAIWKKIGEQKEIDAVQASLDKLKK